MDPSPSGLNWLLPGLGIAVTAIATWFVSKRRAGSDYIRDLEKELGYYKPRVLELENEVAELKRDNLLLIRTFRRGNGA